tara:strand:+ start:102 stop:1004 length:903 start_codon:yes stop_codon:yes gene_type:complete
MSRPVMIAGGCSYTDPNNWKRRIYAHSEKIDAWPQVLANIIKDNHGIDYEVINTGKSGASLGKSIDTIQRAIFPPWPPHDPHPENLIVLGVTDWWREFSTWTEHDYNPPVSYRHMVNHAMKKGEHRQVWHPDWIKENLKSEKHRLEEAEAMGIKPFLAEWLPKYYVWDEYRKRRIHHAFQQIYNLINMAKALEFKVLIYQLLDPLPTHDHFLRDWKIDNPLKENIEPWIISHLHEVFLYDVLRKEKSIIGFPFFGFLGGSNYTENLYKEEYNIADGDSHPNAFGHEAIAKEFYNGWKNLL